MGILLSILYFGGRVPRYFIFHFFRGTFSSCSYIMFHIFLTFWWSRTPTFHFSLFSGYILVLLIHYVSYFSCFLVVAYPDISFFTFFGVRAFSYFTYYGFSTLLFARNVPRYFIFRFFRGTRLLVHHLLWFQHTPIHRKRTPTFYFLHFSGYATQLLNLFPSPLCTKGYRVALASTRYPSTNSLTFYIHISIYQYSSLLPAFSPLLWHKATFRFNEYLPHLC